MQAETEGTHALGVTSAVATAARSTLTMLPHGRIGVFHERDGYRKLTFTTFAVDWLGGMCAPLAASAGSRGAGKLR